MWGFEHVTWPTQLPVSLSVKWDLIYRADLGGCCQNPHSRPPLWLGLVKAACHSWMDRAVIYDSTVSMSSVREPFWAVATPLEGPDYLTVAPELEKESSYSRNSWLCHHEVADILRRAGRSWNQMLHILRHVLRHACSPASWTHLEMSKIKWVTSVRRVSQSTEQERLSRACHLWCFGLCWRTNRDNTGCQNKIHLSSTFAFKEPSLFWKLLRLSIMGDYSLFFKIRLFGS